MNARRAWFVYARPHAGKITARPIHPIGWALLLGVPMPGLAFALLVAAIAGPMIAMVGSLAVTGLALWALFGIVIRRGVSADTAD